MAKHKHIPFDDEKIIGVAKGEFFIDENTTEEELDEMADEMTRQFFAMMEKVQKNEHGQKH